MSLPEWIEPPETVCDFCGELTDDWIETEAGICCAGDCEEDARDAIADARDRRIFENTWARDNLTPPCC